MNQESIAPKKDSTKEDLLSRAHFSLDNPEWEERLYKLYLDVQYRTVEKVDLDPTLPVNFRLNHRYIFGEIESCDVVLLHRGLNYYVNREVMNWLVDLEDSKATNFVVEFHEESLDNYPLLEKSPVTVCHIHDSIRPIELAEALFIAYYSDFPFAELGSPRVVNFMTDFISQPTDSLTLTGQLENSTNRVPTDIEIVNTYLVHVFVTAKQQQQTVDIKKKFFETLQFAIRMNLTNLMKFVLGKVLNSLTKPLSNAQNELFELYKLLCNNPGSQIRSEVSKQLKSIILDFIACNFEHIYEKNSDNTSIRQFEAEDLFRLLAHDELKVTKEILIWELFRQWAFPDFQEGGVSTMAKFQEHSYEFFDKVFRFTLVSEEELKEIMSELQCYVTADVYNSIIKLFRERCELFLVQSQHGEAMRMRNVLGYSPNNVWSRHRKNQNLVLILGGWFLGAQREFIEFFSPSVEKSFVVDEFPFPKTYAYFGLQYHKGYVYLFGGSGRTGVSKGCQRINLFAPADEPMKWEMLQSMPSSRCYLAHCIYDGKIYACGGYDAAARVNKVEVFDTNQLKWIQGVAMGVARSDASCTVLNGRIYVAGGVNASQIEPSMEYFDPSAEQRWVRTENMPLPRSSFALVTYNGRIWAIGGNSSAFRTSSVDSYCPVTDKWSPEASLNLPRSTFQATVIGEYIYVFGGYNGAGPVSSIERYNSHKKQWETIEYLNWDRSGFVVLNLPGEATKRIPVPGIHKPVY